ncbi:LOW QUALITY PROTEIN: hypothetical protein ACG7TL_007723 [Trametes sanguinea]
MGGVSADRSAGKKDESLTSDSRGDAVEAVTAARSFGASLQAERPLNGRLIAAGSCPLDDAHLLFSYADNKRAAIVGEREDVEVGVGGDEPERLREGVLDELAEGEDIAFTTVPSFPLILLMAPNGTATKGPDASEEHKCMGMVQEARERSAKRRAKPQPWIVRKFTILIALAIIVYAFYVYIGRLCVPMIRRDPGALGGRGLGRLIMLWAYEKHVKKSPPPVIKNGLPTWWDTESEADLAAAQYQASQSPPQPEPKAESRHSTSRSRSQVNGDARRHGSTNTRRKPSQNSHAEPEDPNAGITDAIPPVAAARAKATAGKGTLARPERAHTSPSSTHHPQSDENIQPLPGTANAPEAEAKPMMFTRKPPTTPILQPEYRYCHTDGFLKPMRAHHCRACGTFFLIFLFWGFLFSVWTFATSVGLNARAASQRTFFDVDGQQVAIMSLSVSALLFPHLTSGLFVLFTGVLVFTHVDLILSNQSTVESLGVRRMREREKRVIQRLHSWGDFRGKRETRKQWDQEWGRIGKEGHPWWLGSARANWEATMGERVWMWFLPIGKSPDDGLSYELNPSSRIQRPYAAGSSAGSAALFSSLTSSRVKFHFSASFSSPPSLLSCSLKYSPSRLPSSSGSARPCAALYVCRLRSTFSSKSASPSRSPSGPCGTGAASAPTSEESSPCCSSACRVAPAVDAEAGSERRDACEFGCTVWGGESAGPPDGPAGAATSDEDDWEAGARAGDEGWRVTADDWGCACRLERWGCVCACCAGADWAAAPTPRVDVGTCSGCCTFADAGAGACASLPVGMRSVLRRNATLRRTVMSESWSASRSTSHPPASPISRTAAALCLSRPESA